MTQAEKQAKMNALVAERDRLEEQLDAIGKVERLLESYGYTMSEMTAILDVDGRIVDEWADVASEIYDLEREWTDEDGNIELYATEMMCEEG